MILSIHKYNHNSIDISRNTKYTINHKPTTKRSSKSSQEPKGYSRFQYFQKRVVDLTVAGSLFLIALPIGLYTAYRIKKESPGKIFFKQSRVGLNGQVFDCYKFRSMHEDGQFNPYTQENDARIFPFGNTMRKLRIDELPQLFNILKGEMHLIGPRAEWDILVKDYERVIPNYQERHSVAPGITGLAQVCYPYGRNIDDAKKKLEFDMEYINNWSLWKEIKIIYKTVSVVLQMKGM